MRRSARLAEKEAKVENEVQMEPKTKRKRSNDEIIIIARMDNGTMVEALKFLNYCQLAKNSLASKKFRDLIQTHRHRLPLLYVHSIYMYSIQAEPTTVKFFNKELSPEAYNNWVIRSNYSKQIPIESLVASEKSAQSITNGYRLVASARYNDSSHREWPGRTRVFSAEVELNPENWPVFQHFVRLVTDQFIYIDDALLTDQSDVVNLFTEAMDSDHDRLQCKKLDFNLKSNSQKSITWIKNYARCSELDIWCKSDLNLDEALLDFFVTGANCTQSIRIRCRDLSKVVTDFVQKFMELKNFGEVQLVESIDGYFKSPAIEVFKRDYAKFIVKEEGNEDDDSTELRVFEFVNNSVGKKLQLTVETYSSSMLDFSIKIISL